ncbi:DNA cytosine methyltransferase [Thiolapillus sp.]|uniref:DNA cytosine methyltransferase n=2 Tax=Thiolapillus sp. TaxID=2017437 RepID=UPI003AF5D1C9
MHHMHILCMSGSRLSRNNGMLEKNCLGDHSTMERMTGNSPTPIFRRRPIAADLFCGCGGLTVGLKRAGFSVVGAVDIDERAALTYRANHPEVELCEGDIRELAPSEFSERIGVAAGELDLLAGCPPCQGFSRLRTRNKNIIDDPRNELLMEFLAYVEYFEPRFVMLENVPEMSEYEGFGVFLETMERLGYLGSHKVLDAAKYGVPQRRNRLIYLAGRGVEVPFGRESRRMKTVRQSIGGLPKAGESGDSAHDLAERRTSRIMSLIRNIPKDGGSRSELPKKYWLECHKRSDGFKDVYGRMAWDDVAPTITSGCFNPSKGRFLHPEEDRAITMREAALLQGFPRRYEFPTTDNKTAIALMIGNALPPPFIAAHARSILRVMRETDGD